MSVDITSTLNQISARPLQDQIALLHQAWDHLLNLGWQPELTDSQKAEFDRRLEDLDANPQNVVTWTQIVKHVRQPG
jgi:putative addiction module component (TIGR02574 family)